MENFSVDINKKFVKMINDRKSDKIIAILQWISFIALFSVVTRKPVGFIPGLIVSSLVAYFVRPFSLKVIALMIAGYLIMSTIMTAKVTKDMQSDGILEEYLSMIFTDNFFPRFLQRHFGKIIN
jgi:hypothetical protein